MSAEQKADVGNMPMEGEVSEAELSQMNGGNGVIINGSGNVRYANSQGLQESRPPGSAGPVSQPLVG